MSQSNKLGLAKQAYVGAPKPPTKSVPFGNDNHELRAPKAQWNFKTKKVRRQEIINSL